MAISSRRYEVTGRVNQKARTRRALIDAVRGLFEQGIEPTVERAAELAGISRATAYRYFPTQAALFQAAHPEIAAKSLLGPDAPADPRERLDLVLQRFIGQTIEAETELRATLRLSLEPGNADLALRKGRAIAWIGDALSPLEGTLEKRAARKLVLAIRAACGIEALVWLTDVAGLSRKQAGAMLHGTGMALFDSAMRQSA